MKVPLYKCFKEVEALKIESIEVYDDGASINPVDASQLHPAVTLEYMEKHRPQPGGYWVRYKDGYESYSPADVFESGYKIVEEKKCGPTCSRGKCGS